MNAILNLTRKLQHLLQEEGAPAFLLQKVKEVEYYYNPSAYWRDLILEYRPDFLSGQMKVKKEYIWRRKETLHSPKEGDVRVLFYENSIGGKGHILEVYTPDDGWLSVEDMGITPTLSADAWEVERYLYSREG